jgi:plasmid maintenance system antidote protein VapI
MRGKGMDLNALQDELRLTTAELARRLGTSDGYLHDIKTGRRKLSLQMASKLEHLTGKPVVASVVAERTGA